MKAAVVRANELVCYEDYKTPEVAPGTVLVRVRMSGICGSDIPRVLHNGVHFYPIVLGHEFSGDVVQVGEGVTRIQPGMRVSGAPLVPCMKCADCAQGNYALCKHYSFIGSRQQGSFAEYVLLPEQNAVPFDESVSYEMGALFEPSCVALHGLLQADYRGGSDVAVLGGGTIGQFAAQWARILGARTVTMFDLEDSRIALAEKLGCDSGVNTRETNFMEKAMALTGGRGFGTVLECAGSPVTIRMAFDLAGSKANVCMIGTPHSEVKFDWKDWEKMNRKEFRLTGSWMSYSAPFPGREWELTAHEFKTGRLKYDEGLIHAVYPLEKTQEAFNQYKTPGLVQGKIFIKI